MTHTHTHTRTHTHTLSLSLCYAGQCQRIKIWVSCDILTRAACTHTCTHARTHTHSPISHGMPGRRAGHLHDATCVQESSLLLLVIRLAAFPAAGSMWPVGTVRMIPMVVQLLGFGRQMFVLCAHCVAHGWWNGVLELSQTHQVAYSVAPTQNGLLLNVRAVLLPEANDQEKVDEVLVFSLTS